MEIEVEFWGREIGPEVTGFWVLRWFCSGGEQERIMERDSIGDNTREEERG